MVCLFAAGRYWGSAGSGSVAEKRMTAEAVQSDQVTATSRRAAFSSLPDDDPKRIATSLRSVADRDGVTSERSGNQRLNESPQAVQKTPKSEAPFSFPTANLSSVKIC